MRCPLIRIEPLGDEPIDPRRTTGSSSRARTAPRELARRLTATPRADRGDRPGHRRRLREHGLRARSRAARLTRRRACSPSCPPGRVLLAAAEGARRLLVDERGADFLPLYRTVELRPRRRPTGDLVVLASASAARALRGDGRAPPGRRDRPADRGRGARARASTSSRSRSPRPRRAAGRRKFPRVMFITFLTDFGLEDDFVGTCHGVMKRIAPGRRRSSTSRTASGRGACSRARSCSRTRFRTCRPASTSRSSIPASAARGARSRCATPKGGSTSAPTTACSCPPPSASAGSSRRTSSRIPRTRSSPSRARSTAATSSRRRPRISRSASRSASSARRSTPRRSSGSTLPRARGRAAAHPRHRARRRPLREHRAQPRRASISTQVGDRARACGSSSQPAATATTPSRRARSATRAPGDLILYEDSYRNLAVAVAQGSAAALLGVEEGSELVSRSTPDFFGRHRRYRLVFRRQGSPRHGHTGPDA